MIYLDHAAHTMADPAVLAEFCRIEREFTANPLSAHGAGQAAKAELSRITEATARLLAARPDEVIFTSSASEANDLAIKGHAHAQRHKGKHIISTALEHPSVNSPLATLQNTGYEVEMVDILPNAIIDLEHLAALLRRDTILLCISWVDSELGAIQPISEICKLLETYPNCRLHVDAAQAAGKIPISPFSDKGLDSLSISPHKFNGLSGSGILLRREASIIRSGTPALALAASACKALELSLTHLEERYEKVKSLRDYAIKDIKARINSPADGSPYILNLSIAGKKGTEVQAALSENLVNISVKSACSSPGTPSRAVYAVTRDKKNAMQSFRVSFSHTTEFSELDAFKELIANSIH